MNSHLDSVAETPKMPLVSMDTERARRTSRMHQQLVICNGELTGKQCRHYWAMRRITEAANAEMLIKGETIRVCTLWQHAEGPMEFGESRELMAVACTRYEPSDRPFDPELDERAPTPLESDQSGQPTPFVPTAETNMPPAGPHQLTIDDVMNEGEGAQESAYLGDADADGDEDGAGDEGDGDADNADDDSDDDDK